MKNRKITAALTVLLLLTAFVNPSVSEQAATAQSPSTGRIYLYGEQHGVERILEEEIRLWSEHYHGENMRHLFLEYPYYTAELLNLWMQSDNDDILEEIYRDWVGTAAHIPSVLDFYREIKKTLPETVFHGTDVGHQYETTAERYLKYLEDAGLQDSPRYARTLEIIEQGKRYYQEADHVYRENMLVENFIREFDALGGESVMGLFGSAHTDIKAKDYRTQSVPCMARQLYERYADAIHSEDLMWLAKSTEPLRVDMFAVGGKEYAAAYYGMRNLTPFKDYEYREFWRLEDAYDDFRKMPKTGEVLPYDNYPMEIEKGQVFVIDYTLTDGTVTRRYFRADGRVWERRPVTEEFLPE